MLTAAEIKQQIRLGKIEITPFNQDQLNPNSYNLTLASELSHYTDAILDSKKSMNIVTEMIPDSGIILSPGILYLGHTLEKTSSAHFVPMLDGRSSLARLGLSIHQTGGFGDLGFSGTWTLEITVVQHLRIYPLTKIAQICWLAPSGPISMLYKGKYQGQQNTTPSRLHYEF